MGDIMTLDILENSDSIKLADDDLFNSLFKHSIKFGKGKVIYECYNGSKLQNFSDETDIYCLKEKNIWFSHIQQNSRFFYAFGMGDPQNKNLNTPICVIDFSIKDVNRNSLAAFAVDNNSDIFVLLRVNYNKLRDSFNGFLTNSERIQAIELDRKKYFINLGQLNKPNFLINFTKFIEEMGNIKNSNSESNTELPVIHAKNTTELSCVLCSETFLKIEPNSDSPLNNLIKENPDICSDCLEKIFAIEAINEIKKLVSIKLFNERNLVDKVDNPVLFLSYLKILKKHNIIRKFGNNNDFVMFNENKDLEKFNNTYSLFLEGTSDNSGVSDHVSEELPTNVPADVSDKSMEHKICEICGVDLDSDNFYKSDSSQDGFSLKCKKCSRKSYAAHALEKIGEYIEPETPFKKEDLLKQVPNRMQFLDYIWTLQEFNLIIQDEQADTYILKQGKELNEFIEEYGDKKPEISTTTVIATPKKNSVKKIVKECEICNQKLPISDFYKSSSTEDGYSPKCKDCSRKSHAAKALGELRECVEPGVLFFKEDLLNQCENRMQFLDYLWTLLELDLLKNDENSDAYVLKSESELNEFMEKYGQKTPETNTSSDETLEVASLTLDERSTKNPSEVSDTVQINNYDCKEIIYISENMGSIYTNIMMKAIVKNENILSTLMALETIISSNMKKLLINRNITNFSEIIIDLEIKNESLDEILNSLEEENWKNISYNK